MAYEVFERVSARVEEPAITIGNSGVLVFNSAAWRLLAGAGIKRVVFLWDQNASKMAVKAATKNEKNAFAVSGGSHSATVRAGSFLKYIGWSTPKRKLLATTWNGAEKMFEAKIPAHFLGKRT